MVATGTTNGDWRFVLHDREETPPFFMKFGSDRLRSNLKSKPWPKMKNNIQLRVSVLRIGPWFSFERKL